MGSFHFANAFVTVTWSQWTASSSASWRASSPPADFVCGQSSMMCVIVCHCPHWHRWDWAMPQRWRLARQVLSGTGSEGSTVDEVDQRQVVGQQFQALGHGWPQRPTLRHLSTDRQWRRLCQRTIWDVEIWAAGEIVRHRTVLRWFFPYRTNLALTF